MRLVITLIKSSLVTDHKLFIPFVIINILIVFVISATSVSNALFIEFSREPIISSTAGEILLLKSESKPVFISGLDGTIPKWSFQLFETGEVCNVSVDHNITYQLVLVGQHKIDISAKHCLVTGLRLTTRTPAQDIVKGEFQYITDFKEWDKAGRPVMVIATKSYLNSGLNIGDRFNVFIPKIVESGGEPLAIGLSHKASGIDYIDNENGEWVNVKISAIARDHLEKNDAIVVVFPLSILQDISNADNKVNRAGVRMRELSEEELLEKAISISDSYAGFYAIRATDIITGMSKEITDLEKHAGSLLLVVCFIGSLVLICILVLVLQNRNSSYVQLMSLGVTRFKLMLSVAIEIMAISFITIVAGLIFPITLSYIRSGQLLSTSISIISFFLIIPYNIVVSLIVSLVMLPNRKKSLEVLRSE